MRSGCNFLVKMMKVVMKAKTVFVSIVTIVVITVVVVNCCGLFLHLVCEIC